MKSLKYFKTISNDTKLRLVVLLLESELCVCELEEITNIKQANISKNLASLKDAGIVGVRKDRNRAFYFLTEEFKKNKHLIMHLKELPVKEAMLGKDQKTFLKHEEIKDTQVYVCNIFRDEAS